MRLQQAEAPPVHTLGQAASSAFLGSTLGLLGTQEAPGRVRELCLMFQEHIAPSSWGSSVWLSASCCSVHAGASLSPKASRLSPGLIHSASTEWGKYWSIFLTPAITKNLPLGGIKPQKCILSSSGGRDSEIQVWAGPRGSEALARLFPCSSTFSGLLAALDWRLHHSNLSLFSCGLPSRHQFMGFWTHPNPIWPQPNLILYANSLFQIRSRWLVPCGCEFWGDSIQPSLLEKYNIAGLSLSWSMKPINIDNWRKKWLLTREMKIELLYYPTIPLLVIYPKELKSVSQRGICTPLFTAALCSTAKGWMQESIGRWMGKESVVYHTVRYQSALN